MTIWEISEKADYIAERHRRLQDQWRIYCNSLVQGITLSKARLHHAMSCAPDKDLCFVLFEHFTIYVTLADGFNSHTIEQVLEHYLEKIATVYDSLYTAVENNMPVNLSQLVEGHSPA